MKVYIGCPCYDSKIYTQCALALWKNLDTLRQNNIDFYLNFLSNESLITRGRNRIMSEFLSTDADYLFFLDSDISFQDNAIHFLLERKLDIVAGPYPKKHYNWEDIEKEVLNGTKIEDALKLTNPYIINLEKSTCSVKDGCVEVSEVGTGFLLISRRVVQEFVNSGIAREYKHYQDEESKFKSYEFFQSTIGEKGFYLSEDYWFAEQAKRLGFKINLCILIKLDHYGTNKWSGDFMAKVRSKQLPEKTSVP